MDILTEWGATLKRMDTLTEWGATLTLPVGVA